MPSTRASVGDFIAAAIAQPASKHKELLKLEKKLREIEKIEARVASGDSVDSLQREKVAKKESLMSQIQELKTSNESMKSVSSETVVFDAVHKLRSISEDQLEVVKPTGEFPSQATTVSGSDKSGASTPPREGNSDSFWDDPGPPSVPSLSLGPKDEFLHKVAPKARWSDDAILDEDPELHNVVQFNMFTPRPTQPDSFVISTPREPQQAPRSRIGSHAWSDEAKQRNSAWRRVAKDTCTRRVDSYASMVFACLDIDGDGVLNSSELQVFAQATGFVDEEASWDQLYADVCMGAPEAGLLLSDFKHLFKGLMADEQFRERISQVYPERSLRQPRRPHNPRGNRSRCTKPMNPSLMTFEEVTKNCTYEEVLRWCWQQGGYAALDYYIGSAGTCPSQNYMYETYDSYDSSMYPGHFATVYEDNMGQSY